MGDKANPGESRSAATYRAVLAAVILLSILLVLAAIALVVGFVRQYRLYQADQAAQGAAAAAGVRLAPGAHIMSATTDAGRLVLHVHTPAGDEIEIIDLATGKLVSQVKEGQ